MTYRRDIDGLRAIAVLAVLFFHAGFAGFSGGFIGVDVFFVISGFLITKLIVEDGQFSLLGFYQRRARRILPALTVVMLVASIAAYIFFMPEEFAAFGKSVAATTLFSSNILFWSETGYFDAPAELKPLLHTWTLAVEEQFYIIYPLLLIFSRRYLNGRWIVLLLPLTLISLAVSTWLTYRSQDAAFFLAQSRAWEFLLGCLLAVGAVPQLANRVLREALGVIGLALIAWSVVTYSEGMRFPGLNALAPCVGAAILIWLAGERDTVAGRILASEPLVSVGLISYSLYLWHWPILVFVRYIAMHELSLTARIASLLCSFPLAYLSWHYVELPVRRGSYWKGRRLLTACATTGLASFGFGLLVAATNGLPGRISPEILALQGIIHDRRDCHFVTVERVDSGTLCIRGAPDRTPSFVLVGDSHADALSPGVFEAAARVGVSGYQFTAPGFRPLPGAVQLTDLTDRFVEFLRQNSSIRLVIVNGFWAYRAAGEGYGRPPHVFRDEGYDGSGLAYNKISLKHGLQRLVDAFPDRRFVIVEDVPVGAEFDVAYAARAMHIQAILGRGHDQLHTTRFGISRERYEIQLASYRPILDEIAKAPNVSIVPLIYQLCDSQFCAGARNGVLLYRNGDHLSKAGGELFADLFFHAIARADAAQRER